MPLPADGSLEAWCRVQAELHKLFVHDIKNPISAITSNLSFVESMLTDVDEDLRSALSDCLVAAQVLLHMADNLSLIARLEAGDHVEPATVSVTRLVHECVSRVRELSQLSDVKVNVTDDLPDRTGRWEIPYAKLILENLILCALQNAPTGGRVDVGASSGAEGVRIAVWDDGSPVDEGYRSRSFERDFQPDAKSLPGARYARALGLYAAGLAARFIGGRVSVGATGDGRAEFAVVLPT